MKVLVCLPNNYLLRKVRAEFNELADKSLVKLPETLSDPDQPGLFLLEFKELVEATDVLPQSLLLVDEADRGLFQDVMRKQAHKAKGLVGLSASFGGHEGFERLKLFFKSSFQISKISMDELSFNVDNVVSQWHDFDPKKNGSKRSQV